TVLTGSNLIVTGAHGQKALDIDHLELRRGEVLGICGVEGNGQTELIEVLSGLRAPDTGTVRLKDSDVTGANPNTFRADGLSYIPEDRHNRGLVLDFPLWENMLLGNAWHEPFATGGRINRGRTREITATLMQ